MSLEMAVIVSNVFVVVASLALALVTAADVEKDQQRTLREAIKALAAKKVKRDTGSVHINPEVADQ